MNYQMTQGWSVLLLKLVMHIILCLSRFYMYHSTFNIQHLCTTLSSICRYINNNKTDNTCSRIKWSFWSSSHKVPRWTNHFKLSVWSSSHKMPKWANHFKRSFWSSSHKMPWWTNPLWLKKGLSNMEHSV